MLAMNARKQPLSESLKKLHVVPVSISYEYDACDVLKAEELYQTETKGSFTKTDESDIESIVTGMIGFKGAVHVAFGSEMQYESDDPEEIVASIDKQILQNYKLRDSNFIALEMLRESNQLPERAAGMIFENRKIEDASRDIFAKRLMKVDAKLQKHYLLSYANPVISCSPFQN
jgi:hypothetical protein